VAGAHAGVGRELRFDGVEAAAALREAAHAGLELHQDAVGVPVRLDAFLEHGVEVGAQRLGCGRRLASAVGPELAGRPGEALDQALPHLILHRLDQLPGPDQLESQERRPLLAVLALHVARDLGVVFRRDGAGLDQLLAQRLARAAGLGGDGEALLEAEGPLQALAGQAQRAAEARAVELEQEPGEGSLLQTAALGNALHRHRVRADRGATLRGHGRP
jgi:hypothetical protein